MSELKNGLRGSWEALGGVKYLPVIDIHESLALLNEIYLWGNDNFFIDIICGTTRAVVPHVKLSAKSNFSRSIYVGYAGSLTY